MDRLTEDINNWVLSVEPTKQDLAERHELYQKLFAVCSQNWIRGPFRLELFGSWKTNLLLPGSDIDVVIMDKSFHEDPKNAMGMLTKSLQRSGSFKNVYFVRNARVPIIKVQGRFNALTADISCNVTDGLDGANFLVTHMQMVPTFRPVFLVAKKLLIDYDLNDASNGGLGSYALSDPRAPIGAQLLGFFDYYGNKFQAKLHSVNFALLGGLASRDTRYLKSDILVDNPLVIDHNVAAACRKWYQVQRLFQTAYTLLNKLVPLVLARDQMHTKPKKGDFHLFPMLYVLTCLNTPSAPERIFNKVGHAMHKVVDLVMKKNKHAHEVIILDDAEDYDSITHTEQKKRKRDDEEERDEDADENEPKSQKTEGDPATFTTYDKSGQSKTHTNLQTPHSPILANVILPTIPSHHDTHTSSSATPSLPLPSSSSHQKASSSSSSSTATTTTSSSSASRSSRSNKKGAITKCYPEGKKCSKDISLILLDLRGPVPTSCTICEISNVEDYDQHIITRSRILLSNWRSSSSHRELRYISPSFRFSIPIVIFLYYK